MKRSDIMHREAVQQFMDSTQPLVRLSERDLETIQHYLGRLYQQFGDLNWIDHWFMDTLNAYWNTMPTGNQDAARHEVSINDYQTQMIPARQFERLPASSVQKIVWGSDVNPQRYWCFNQPYPPNFELIGEPYRSYYVILDDWLKQLHARDDPQGAMYLSGGFIAGLCQTFPTHHLDQDKDFQRYISEEVLGELTDDDYTFYMSRKMFYILFDRQMS
jgi:hypothetical protein